MHSYYYKNRLATRENFRRTQEVGMGCSKKPTEHRIPPPPDGHIVDSDEEDSDEESDDEDPEAQAAIDRVILENIE